MENINVSINPIRFNSRKELREFCLSSKLNNLVKSLEQTAAGLIETSRTEYVAATRQGCREENLYEVMSAYAQNEIDRLLNLKKYFSGIKPPKGYAWKYVDGALPFVKLRIDSRNLRKSHPAFREYLLENRVHKLQKEDIDYIYEVWKSNVLKPSLNNLFKLTYCFSIKNIISNDIKMTR